MNKDGAAETLLERNLALYRFHGHFGNKGR
jgi:hypothetical protein